MKKSNKEVKQLINTNNDVKSFIDYLLENYEFKEEEQDIFDSFKKHMDNLNIIFSKVRK